MAESRLKKHEVNDLIAKANCKRLVPPEPTGKEPLKYQCLACGEKFARHTTAQNHHDPCSRLLSVAAAARRAAGGHDDVGPVSRPATGPTSAAADDDVIGIHDGAGPSGRPPSPPDMWGPPNDPAHSDDLFDVRTCGSSYKRVNGREQTLKPNLIRINSNTHSHTHEHHNRTHNSVRHDRVPALVDRAETRIA
jgi:hypothetical protein